MIIFVTANDVKPHLFGYLEFFKPKQFDAFSRYVWEHGRGSAHGVHVYRDNEAREDDINEDLDSDDDVATVRGTPTLDELAAGFIRDVLHENPSDYAL